MTAAGSAGGASPPGGARPGGDGGGRGDPSSGGGEVVRPGRSTVHPDEGRSAGRADERREGDGHRTADVIRFWYRRHADRVYRYARWRTGSRQRAEEVVSDVFLEAWRSRDAYDPERGSVESWLLGIARNVLRRRERADARDAERRKTADLDDLASPGPGPEEEALRRRRHERILEAVWELPSADRDLVALAYGADLPRRRIARMLDLSPEAVRVRLHRVLGRLRERVGERER